jgi:uncharacterized protein
MMDEQGIKKSDKWDERETDGAEHCPPAQEELKGEDALSLMAVMQRDIYGANDLALMQSGSPPTGTPIHSLRSLDELLERDRLREKDGFPRKIRIGRLVKPGRGARERIILVPTTVEEKFIHDTRDLDDDEEAGAGGSGEGEEGEVIGEEPIHGSEGPGSGGAGQGDGEEHAIESNAYDLGRILTEKFELPNLRDKGKKRFLTRETYDLTDRHKGFGQILDKKATLRKIIETNIGLGFLKDVSDIDPVRLLVSPEDRVYRILSREREYESQAMVFFVRDYSGSMSGKPTELVVSQHVLIYSWLFYQYEKQVETRFILHDTDAKEVPDFYTYYSSTVAGGTRVESAYRLVNELVEAESLARDYNIYVFHGTDGDDWDSDGSKTLPELEKMLTYSNRVGVTVAKANGGSEQRSTIEYYLKKSGLLESQSDRIRMDMLSDAASEAQLIEGIKNLIS